MKFEIVNTDTVKNQDIVKLANGKEVRVPRVEVQKSMAVLGISRHEALEMYLEDEGYLENEEVEKLTKKAKVNKTTLLKARVKAENKKTVREPKINPVKQQIIQKLVENALKKEVIEGISNVKIENPTKIITFTLENKHFKLDLIEKREKK